MNRPVGLLTVSASLFVSPDTKQHLHGYALVAVFNNAIDLVAARAGEETAPFGEEVLVDHSRSCLVEVDTHSLEVVLVAFQEAASPEEAHQLMGRDYVVAACHFA